jgi:hypothetical protein
MEQTVLADQTGANILKILRGKLDVGCFRALHRGLHTVTYNNVALCQFVHCAASTSPTILSFGAYIWT